MNITVTVALFHPAALGAGLGEAEMVNVGVDKVTGIEIAAEFPAISVACTMIVFNPAVNVRLQEKLDAESVAGEPLQVALAMPEIASVTVPAMVI